MSEMNQYEQTLRTYLKSQSIPDVLKEAIQWQLDEINYLGNCVDMLTETKKELEDFVEDLKDEIDDLYSQVDDLADEMGLSGRRV